MQHPKRTVSARAEKVAGHPFGHVIRTKLRATAQRRGITSHSGELLGYANYFTSIVIGLAVAIAARSVGWGFVALIASFLALFAMLADRHTIYLAAVVATGTIGLTLGAVGWLIAGGLGALLIGGGAGAITASLYRTIARRLSALGDEWY